MNETIRFGRIAGIPVGAHWSVLLMMVLVTDTVASAALPALVPGHGAAAYWLTAVAAAVLFAGSLLGHELAHALVARRFGMPVQRITLWMLGGVSVLGGEPDSARAAFWIAAAGPATSIGIGALGGGAALLMRAAGAPDLLLASTLWLALMNVVLGLFNLLPGVPLDGGRVLRALLWRRYGDPDRATAVASRAGQLVGGLVGLGGLVQLLYGDAGGLWLLAVGYVIVIAATAEGGQARSRQARDPGTVARIMRPAEVAGETSMPAGRFLAEVVPDSGQLVYPVLGAGGRTAGVVSLAALTGVPAGTLLGDVMTPFERLPAVEPGTPIAELDRLLSAAGADVALVVDRDVLAGLVTGYDVARALETARGQAAVRRPNRPSWRT